MHDLEAELKPLLLAGERIVWADGPHHGLLKRLGLPPRTPAALLGMALALTGLVFGLGAVTLLTPRPVAAVLVIAAAVLVVVLAGVLAWRRTPRAVYAATDRARGIVVESGRAMTFSLPPRIAVTATLDLEMGELDLGPLDVLVDGAVERREVRLHSVAYPRVVAELLEGVAARPPASVDSGA